MTALSHPTTYPLAHLSLLAGQHRIAFIFLAFFCSAGAIAQTADEIIKRHIKVLGGIERLNSVKTYYQVESFTFGASTGNIQTWLEVGKKYRRETDQSQILVCLPFGESNRWGWKRLANKFDDMTDTEIKGYKDRLYPPVWRFVNYKERGDKVSFKGIKNLGLNEAYELEVTDKKGKIANYYIDTDTHLVIGMYFMAHGAPYSVIFKDYKEYEGIKIFSTMETTTTTGTTKEVVVFKTTEVKINEPNPKWAFMPFSYPQAGDFHEIK